MAVIAILSGSFCHGDEVTARVVEQLGYKRIDGSVLERAAEGAGVAVDKLERVMHGGTPLLNRLTRGREKSVAALQLSLAEGIRDDNCLVHGPLALLAPRSVSHALRVCLIANRRYRVDQVMSLEGKQEREAEKIIHRDDEQRLEWSRLLFEREPYDESLYDLIIPMHEKSIEEAAAIIVEQAGGDAIRTTERSQQAAADFLLSSRVNRLLVEAGHEVDVTAEKGHVTLTLNKYTVRAEHYQAELKRLVSEDSDVANVTTKLGPGFVAPSSNPWANVEIPPKVLLVDDEKDYVQTLSERLETRNIDSSVVYDGEQALEFVKEDEPDVMVLDLMMPGIDGIEVLRRVKREHAQIEVIILTGHGSDREETLAMELGAFAYLHKPVDLDELARTMKDAYSKVNAIRARMRRGDPDADSVDA